TAMPVHRSGAIRNSCGGCLLEKGYNSLPLNFWPTDVYGDQWDTFINGDSILLLHEPAAHTAGDTVVFFRRRMSSAPGTCSHLTATRGWTSKKVERSMVSWLR